jgi:hypothetical protein
MAPMSFQSFFFQSKAINASHTRLFARIKDKSERDGLAV